MEGWRGCKLRLDGGKRILVWSCKPLHRVDFHTYIVKLVSVCDTIYQQKGPRLGLNSNADILLPKQSEASRASAHRSIHAKIKQVPNRTVSPTKPQTHEQPRFEQLLFSLFRCRGTVVVVVMRRRAVGQAGDCWATARRA